MTLYKRVKRAIARELNDPHFVPEILVTEWCDDDKKTDEELITELKDEYKLTDSSWYSYSIEYDFIKILNQESKMWNWIPVTERLPEENKTVIASSIYGVYPEARYTKEDGWEWAYESGADYWEGLEGVTAWMPLPELYKNKEVIE